MYAIILDIDNLNDINNISNIEAYKNIKEFMEKNSFICQQGNLYFGKSKEMSAVYCVITIQKLAKEYTWFSTYVKNIKMLKIDEISDLMPAISII